MTIVRQAAALCLLFGSYGASVFALAKDEGPIGTVAQEAAVAADNAKDKTAAAALMAHAAMDNLSSKVAADIERAARAAYDAAEEAIYRSRAAHSEAVMRAPAWVGCAQDTAEKSAAAAHEALMAASVSVQKSMQPDEEAARRAAQQARMAMEDAANAALSAASAAKGVWDEERRAAGMVRESVGVSAATGS